MKIKKAFTLIELMVVVTIILIISSIIFVSFENAQKKSRDAKRKSDLTTIQTALEMYYRENGEYPYSATATATANRFDPASQLTTYLSSYPKDPKNSCSNLNPDLNNNWLGENCFVYSYIVDKDGQKYLLWANLETESGNGSEYSSQAGPYNSEITGLMDGRQNKIYIVEKH